MPARLRDLVHALEDDPWCGTRPPHWPPLPPRRGSLEELVGGAFAAVELNPQPLPPRRSPVVAALMQQVRLFQIGQQLETLRGAPAEVGAQMSSLAADAFDGTCGSVPLSVLLQILLHHPPPPPPPWLQDIEQLALQVRLGARMEGATGAPLQQAGLSMLKGQLAGLSERQRGASPG